MSNASHGGSPVPVRDGAQHGLVIDVDLPFRIALLRRTW
jgi:hypothetical protein